MDTFLLVSINVYSFTTTVTFPVNSKNVERVVFSIHSDYSSTSINLFRNMTIWLKDVYYNITIEIFGNP